MNLEVTPEAAALLGRSLELGGLDPQQHGVRLRVTRALGGGSDVQVELAEAPGEGEVVVAAGGVNLFVSDDVARLYPAAVVTVEPQHDLVVVRPAPPPR